MNDVAKQYQEIAKLEAELCEKVALLSHERVKMKKKLEKISPSALPHLAQLEPVRMTLLTATSTSTSTAPTTTASSS